MVIFITYLNTSETNLLVLYSLCYYTGEDFSEMLQAGFRKNDEKRWKIVKNVGKMAIWWGIIVFITHFNKYGTNTNTCGKILEATDTWFLKKCRKLYKNEKNVKKWSKMSKNGKNIGYNRIYYLS